MTPGLDEIKRRAMAATQGEWTAAAHIDSYATVTLALVARIRELEGALKRLAQTPDCGCKPCRGQCSSREALAIELDERCNFASAALNPTDPAP